MASKLRAVFVDQDVMSSADKVINNYIIKRVENNDQGLFGGLCFFTDWEKCPGYSSVHESGTMMPITTPGRRAVMYNVCTEILLQDQSITNALKQVNLTSNSSATKANMLLVFDVFFPGFSPDDATIDSLTAIYQESKNKGLSSIDGWRMVMTAMCRSTLFEVY